MICLHHPSIILPDPHLPHPEAILGVQSTYSSCFWTVNDKSNRFPQSSDYFCLLKRAHLDSVNVLQPNAAQYGPTTPLTPACLSSSPLPWPSLLFHFQRLPPFFSPSFGPRLRFIARGRPTAEKPPCMERSVISTLSSKHTAFHIVLQGLGQIAIFMGHDKGNAALCSHFLLPGVRAGHAVIHPTGNCRGLSGICCYVAEKETCMNIVVKVSDV